MPKLPDDRHPRFRAGASIRLSGFTLIELLTVTAIIALVIAVLCPSLAQARRLSQATVLASNVHQGTVGAILRMVEMGKSRWSTNFGWATWALKANGGSAGVFTCPSDPDPRPTPAILAGGALGYTTAADSVFNRTLRYPGDVWQTDIQDLVNDANFGFDAYQDNEGYDTLVEYSASPRQAFSSAHVADLKGYPYDLFDYRGRSLWPRVQPGSGPFPVTLLWMSYGASASAGLANVKGNPALILETSKNGVFPEDLPAARLYKQDRLPWVLRFRHGGLANRSDLTGCDYTHTFTYPDPVRVIPPYAIDRKYIPGTRTNVGFLDGHVEAMGYAQLFDLSVMPIPRPAPRVWFGSRNPGTYMTY